MLQIACDVCCEVVDLKDASGWWEVIASESEVLHACSPRCVGEHLKALPAGAPATIHRLQKRSDGHAFVSPCSARRARSGQLTGRYVGMLNGVPADCRKNIHKIAREAGLEAAVQALEVLRAKPCAK